MYKLFKPDKWIVYIRYTICITKYDWIKRLLLIYYICYNERPNINYYIPNKCSNCSCVIPISNSSLSESCSWSSVISLGNGKTKLLKTILRKIEFLSSDVFNEKGTNLAGSPSFISNSAELIPLPISSQPLLSKMRTEQQ